MLAFTTAELYAKMDKINEKSRCMCVVVMLNAEYTTAVVVVVNILIYAKHATFGLYNYCFVIIKCQQLFRLVK